MQQRKDAVGSLIEILRDKCGKIIAMALPSADPATGVATFRVVDMRASICMTPTNTAPVPQSPRDPAVSPHGKRKHKQHPQEADAQHSAAGGDFHVAAPASAAAGAIRAEPGPPAAGTSAAKPSVDSGVDPETRSDAASAESWPPSAQSPIASSVPSAGCLPSSPTSDTPADGKLPATAAAASAAESSPK